MNLKIIQNNSHVVRRKGFLIGQRTALKWNRDGKNKFLSGDIVHNEFVIRVFIAVCKFAGGTACACGAAAGCAGGAADACPPC